MGSCARISSKGVVHGMDLAVDLALADAPRDELRRLRAEVEDEDEILRHGGSDYHARTAGKSVSPPASGCRLLPLSNVSRRGGRAALGAARWRTNGAHRAEREREKEHQAREAPQNAPPRPWSRDRPRPHVRLASAPRASAKRSDRSDQGRQTPTSRMDAELGGLARRERHDDHHDPEEDARPLRRRRAIDCAHRATARAQSAAAATSAMTASTPLASVESPRSARPIGRPERRDDEDGDESNERRKRDGSDEPDGLR